MVRTSLLHCGTPARRLRSVANRYRTAPSTNAPDPAPQRQPRTHGAGHAMTVGPRHVEPATTGASQLCAVCDIRAPAFAETDRARRLSHRRRRAVRGVGVAAALT